MDPSFKISLERVELAGKIWQANDTLATLCIIHGLGEHSNRYDHFASKMTEKGITVFSTDLPGHGKSSGKKGHANEHELMDTVEKLSEIASSSFPDRPMFIYGQSMGGNIVLRYILTKKHAFKGAIVSSPWLELSEKPPLLKLLMGRLMHKIYPGYTDSTGLNPEHISRSEEEVERYKNDPLIHDKITTELFFTIVKNGKWILENTQHLRTPLLLMHGTGDQLTSYRACEKFANKFPQMTDLKLWENAYHELHNDVIKEEVINFIIAWIYKHI